jgi:hypothetical protein
MVAEHLTMCIPRARTVKPLLMLRAREDQITGYELIKSSLQMTPMMISLHDVTYTSADINLNKKCID